jgi:hypothetical protein
MNLHFDEHREGSVSELLSPAGWQQQLDLGPETLRQRHLKAAHSGEGELPKSRCAMRPRVVQNPQQPVCASRVHPGQW